MAIYTVPGFTLLVQRSALTGLALTMLGVVVLSGCASQAPQKPSPGQLQIEVAESARAVMDPDLSRVSMALHSFLVGQLAYGKEDLRTATSNLMRASELATGAVSKINITLAELKLKAGDAQAALLEVEKALDGDPQNIQLRLLRAGILDVVGHGGEAQAEYIAISKIEPLVQDAHYLAAAMYGRDRRFREGIALLERYLKAEPRNNLIQYLLGLLHENAGELNRAARNYREVVKRSPDNISVQFDLLRVLLKADDREGASAIAQEMLRGQLVGGVFAAELLREVGNREVQSSELAKTVARFAPDEVRLSDLRLKLALVHVQEQQFSGALREFSLIIALEPHNSVARYYRASLYGGAGRKREAYDDLFAIRSGQELFIKSRIFAAFLKKQEGDFKGAEKAVRDALSAAPQDQSLFAYLIVVLREGKHYERGLALVNEELKKSPGSERLLFNKGILLSDLHRAAEARMVMEQVITINSGNSDALNFIAYDLAENAQDLDRAEGLAQRAIELAPDDGFYLDTLGWIYFQRQEYLRAVEVLRKAHKKSGGDIVVSEHFGDALMRTGAVAEAADVYRLALEKGRDLEPSDRSAEVVDVLPRLQDKLNRITQEYPELLPSQKISTGIAP